MLRQATLDDLPALLALEHRAFDRPWPEGAFEQELTLPQAEVWMATDGDQAIGYVDFWIVHGEVSLLNVAVDPGHRRQGLARRLLACMQSRAEEEDADAIFLEVRRGNDGARALYSSEGFEQIGIRKRYYSDTGEDALVLSKPVPGVDGRPGIG